jgi:N-acetylglucosamine-6-phosphate deacetylase
MTERLVLHAARVLTPQRVLEPGWVAITAGRVSDVGAGAGPAPKAGPVVDLGVHTLVPGFIDTHVHGGGGAQVNTGSAEQTHRAVSRLAGFHARHGTTALVATTVSDDPTRLRASLAGIAAATAPTEGAAEVLGAHLEGPWIAPARAGAHPHRWLAIPDRNTFDELAAASDGALRLVTLAPELPGALPLARHAIAAGVRCAFGHTDADYDTTRAAIDAGVHRATHLFNAMPSLHHRAPGPIAAALEHPEVTVELIADGIHTHPAMLGLAARAAGTRASLVTDATSAAGLPDGRHDLAGQTVDVTEGRVSLAAEPGTLAGSTLTMDRALSTLVTQAGIPLPQALAAATLAPAAALNLPHKGHLEPGADADAVVLDAEMTVRAVLTHGHAAHDPENLLTATPARTGPSHRTQDRAMTRSDEP